MKAINLLTFMLLGFTILAQAQADPELEITIDSSRTRPKVEFANSVFKADIKSYIGGACGIEYSIRDWIIKSVEEDQVSLGLDGNSYRGPLERATLVADSDSIQTVRAEYENCSDNEFDISATTEYSIFPNSPVIRINYLKLPQTGADIIDKGTPGGAAEGVYRFYGDQEYASLVRGFVPAPENYWNAAAGDPVDGGQLNYNGYLIMVVGNPENGHGYGRVVPLGRSGESGGTRAVSLLGDSGFENLTGAAMNSQPFVSYLFVFERGLDEAILMGQAIADGDMLIGGYKSANQPPSAHVETSRTSGEVPLKVTFDTGGSSDPDGTIVKYEWDFGDGDVAEGVQVEHTYYIAGSYTARLTVSDEIFYTDSAFVSIETTWPENKWWSIKDTLVTQKIIENRYFRYRHGQLNSGFHFSGIRDFVNKETGEDHALIIEALGTGYAEYDPTVETFSKVLDENDYLEMYIRTGKSEKVERMYKDLPLMEIQYTAMGALWVEDKFQVAGSRSRLAFSMYGMDDVVGIDRGQELWQKAEAACGHNFGDCFIRANGSTVLDVTYRDHFIYGMINLDTGKGIGFVYPTRVAVHDWKVWWDDVGQISIEFFPESRVGTRYIFLIDGGREEMIEFGKMVVDSKLDGQLPSRPGQTVENSCDFNADGTVSVTDVIALLLYQRNNPADTKGDFNGDGEMNILDAVALLVAQRDGECSGVQ